MIALLASAGRAVAADLLVPSQFTTIQDAVNAAANGDRVLIAPGTYPGGIDLLGKSVELIGTGGAAGTIIDAGGTTAGIFADFSVSVRIVGLTVRNGFGDTFNGAGVSGGDVGFLAVEDCVFSGNLVEGGSGGGVYISNGTLVVRGSTFTGNTGNGGGVGADDSTVTITGSTFSQNTAIGASGGGAAAFNGTMDISDSVFDDNLADGGEGGGLSYSGTAGGRVDRCTFTGNIADGGSGGAIAVTNSANPLVVNSRMSGNSTPGGSGGAVVVKNSAQPTFANCVIVNNVSSSGGAFRIENASTPRIINCTIVGNNFAGIVAVSTSAPVITNSIVRLNTGSSAQILRAGTGVTTVTYSNVQGGVAGVGNINAAPLFADPGNGDYALLAGSPGIDAGNSTAVPSGVTADFAGLNRVQDDPATADTGIAAAGGVVDIGAYEFGVPCIADVDGVPGIDLGDFFFFLNCFDTTDPCADVDGNPGVDLGDFFAFLNAFDAGC